MSTSTSGFVRAMACECAAVSQGLWRGTWGAARAAGAVCLAAVLVAPVPAAAQRSAPDRHAHEKAPVRLEPALARAVDAVNRGASPDAALADIGFAGRVARGSRLPVAIRLDGDDGPVRNWLAAAGLTIAWRGERVLHAAVPLRSMSALAQVEGVARIDSLRRAEPRVTSQAVAIQHAAAWHRADLTGERVKVGIVDVGFAGFAALQGSELPPAVHARCYTQVGVFSTVLADCETGSPHGTAVAEALVDVAPGATLYLARITYASDFAAALAWMSSQGVRVVNVSLGFTWDGPGDGTSLLADSPLHAVNQAANDGAVVLVAAGNEEGATWTGVFADADNDGNHEFAPTDEFSCVELGPGELVRLQMRWSDTWSAATSDLDLYLVDYETRADVASSTSQQLGRGGDTPFEYLEFVNPGSSARLYCANPYRYAGAAPGLVQVQAFTSQPLDRSTPGHSIGNPAESANAAVLAVGAAAHYNTQAIESFSSRGPTADNRAKPDLVAIDRADSATFGPNGFVGTSQATPHAAGLVALLADPLLALARDAWIARLKAATASAPIGVGVARLDDPCRAVLSPRILTIDAGGASGHLQLVTQPGCAWTAVSSAVWAAVAPPASGVGDGSLSYVVAANPGAATRTATLSAFGSRVTIIQPGASAADTDGDGLPTYWEGQFGLDDTLPGGGSGASDDPDGDGRTNLQELEAGTHPRGVHTRYFAEGATGAFFSTQLALVNTGVSAAHVLLRFLEDDGGETSHVLLLPPATRTTVDVGAIAGLESSAFATVAESDELVAIDRTMTWSRDAYGSHVESAVAAPSTVWYLAEGATHSGFNLFYLFQNPSRTAAATVRLRLLRPTGPPADFVYGIPPSTRLTVWVNGIAGFAATDVSAVVDVLDGVPIVAERAMYLSSGAQYFGAGHAAAGVTAPATRWFLAEGATGSYFDTFVLLANPNAVSASVELTYLLAGGGVARRTHVVPAMSRATVWVDTEPGLENAAISVAVDATHPIVVERSMWWPGPTPATWTEAHASAGALETGTSWMLAEGAVGGTHWAETYVLIANTSTVHGTCRVTLLFEDGASVARTYVLPASSRHNVPVASDFPDAAGRQFSVRVESLGPNPAQLVVERAVYAHANGMRWAAGTNASGLRLQ